MMLQNYDPNFTGIHVVRFTFMAWEYVGHVAFPVGGNCHGADILEPTFLETDNQEDIDHYTENDCQFSYHEDADSFSAMLLREDGDILEFSGSPEEFKEILVAAEITECRSLNAEAASD